MGQEISHHIRANRVIDSKGLEREYNTYLRYQNAHGGKDTVWTRKTAEMFLSDMRSHLGLVRVAHHVAEGEEEESLPERIPYDVFRRYFVDLSREQFELSESLCRDGGLPSISPSSAVAVRPLLDIPHSSVIVPADEHVFCPPGQLFHQEWSLILGHLDPVDLNRVNLVCRFFRTTLEKHPPPSWRIARINSLQQRTNTAIGSSLSHIERMRTIVRLEIGLPSLGNMLTNTDLVLIVDNLRALRGLKLLYCHLVSAFPCCETLTSLSLWNMSVPIENVTDSFPNLEDLIVSGMWRWPTKDLSSGMSFCSFVLDLPKLKRFAIGGVADFNHIGLDAVAEKQSLTHLWIEGSHANVAADPRRVFLLTEDAELELLERLTRLQEYVCFDRSAAFAKKVPSRIALVNARSFDNVWEYPPIASYSWRSK